MAVLIKDFTWTQTNDQVVVRVPLRGVHASKVDLFTHSSYIKVSFKPFLFEAFLLHLINESTSKVLITDGEVLFHLEKKDKHNQWKTLCADLSREEKHKAREIAIQEVQLQQQNERVKRQELLQDLKRKSVQQQIDLEKKEKNDIDKLRNAERETAMRDLTKWKANRATHDKTNIIFETEDILQSGDENPVVETRSQEKPQHSYLSGTECSSEEFSKQVVQRSTSVHLDEEDLKPVPFTRTSGSIKVKFTPRAFPTPQRESKTDEEQEWLQKQIEARRATGFIAEDLRPEECNPQWLKDKGDSFFQMGNYLGAVSAYSHGIKLSEKMASLYVNRSAAHLALGNLRRVIEDTSMALELMIPKVTQNKESRARCHARRGAALCQLGMLESGLMDLEEALRLQPNDQKLQTDIVAIKAKLQNSSE